jgi:hypothetical protein
LNLIAISDASTDPFLVIVGRPREKSLSKPPSLDEIPKEVEAVRSKRYANKM